jgi:hypothetical protein
LLLGTGTTWPDAVTSQAAIGATPVDAPGAALSEIFGSAGARSTPGAAGAAREYDQAPSLGPAAGSGAAAAPGLAWAWEAAAEGPARPGGSADQVGSAGPAGCCSEPLSLPEAMHYKVTRRNWFVTCCRDRDTCRPASRSRRSTPAGRLGAHGRPLPRLTATGAAVSAPADYFPCRLAAAETTPVSTLRIASIAAVSRYGMCALTRHVETGSGSEERGAAGALEGCRTCRTHQGGLRRSRTGGGRTSDRGWAVFGEWLRSSQLAGIR